MALRVEDGLVEPSASGGAAPPVAAASTPQSDTATVVPTWLRLLLATGSGVALAVAFPPLGWAWITPLAVGALTLACKGLRLRTAALVGLGFGVGFFAVLLQWIRVIGLDGWVALSLIEAVFVAALGAGIALVTRLRGWPVWVAALWVAVELARGSIPLGGFPWGRLAFALDSTPMAAYASLGGVAFVSFVVALAGNLLAWALLARSSRVLTRAGAGLAVVALALGGLLVPLPTSGQGTATVAVVQGNVPARGMEFLGRARTVTRNHLAATEELMRDVAAGKVPKPEFVVWPENSTDIDPFADPTTGSIVEQAVAAAGVPVLVGAILNGPGDDYRRTTGVVWDPDTGPGETYVKQHPVPFGEYIPFRQLLLPYIDRLQMVGRDTFAGSDPGLMTIAGYDIAEVICFEIAYDGIVGEVARADSQLLVVQTNNSTYLGTGQPQQQFAITRLRSIEYGKATLVASPSGISGVISPDGTVVAKSREATRQTYVERVPLRTSPTLAARLGPAPERLAAIVGFGAVVVAVARSRRTRRVETAAGGAGSGGDAEGGR
ncbi:apolipoprotein N-acyltransferase [Actinopolymorpha sp. B17G11]|uniref:apolipoprotein N-acyltransferase n=1 Tax=unclassified Actinopolymorpha TaxID=2627063 RepID=UPI0032D9233D